MKGASLRNKQKPLCFGPRFRNGKARRAICNYVQSRVVNTKVLTSLVFALCFAVHAQTTEQEWQREAIRRYPSLAIRGSPLNNAFVTEYQRRRNSPSEARLFANPRWPVVLADECANQVAASSSAARTPTPANAPPVAHRRHSTPIPDPSRLTPSNAFSFILGGATVIAVLLLFAWFRKATRRRPAANDWKTEYIGRGPVKTTITNHTGSSVFLKVRSAGVTAAQVELVQDGARDVLLAPGNYDTVMKFTSAGATSYYRGPGFTIPPNAAIMRLTLHAAQKGNLIPISPEEFQR